MRKIGIYGGTFDPIHHAHLILARAAMEELQLEHVIFVPAALSPHKLQETPTSAGIRLEMLRAAVEGEACFTIDEIEIKRPPPSFTIDTVEELQRRNPQHEIFCLVGSDNLAALHTWHRFQVLRSLVRFVILERAHAARKSEYLIIRRLLDISATEIRNRVATGRSIRYLVPPSVEAIIHREQLYQEPKKSPQKI